jgi:GDP-L-fucose synthase
VLKTDGVFVAGHEGMVGSAIVRLLRTRGFTNLILRTHRQLDLMDGVAVRHFFEAERPHTVILAAARVGGIQANIAHPAEFLFDNLVIQNNVIHQSYLHGVTKFCFIGSSCVYPRECPQPMKEEYLLTGPLEPTNEGYALAKIAGLKLAVFYRKQYGFPSVAVMPCNLYGTNDSYDPTHSHVLSALVKKFVDATDQEAESVVMWGTGRARREFMHVDDAAEAVLFFMEHEAPPFEFVNIGWGNDISISELASLIALKVGYPGRIVWDSSKPDGMPRKCLDVSRMKALDFTPQISLDKGIEKTIQEYRTLKHIYEDTPQ